MIQNKTVYLMNGETKLCEYNTDDIALSALWNIVFILSVLLNIAGIVGNVIVIVACFLQKQRQPLIIYIHALAFSDLFYALTAPFTTYR